MEKDAIRARLVALGVEVPADPNAPLEKAAFAKAKIKIGDLERVTGELGVVDLAKLDQLHESVRWFGARTIPIDRGDPTQARATINEHLGQLELVEQKFKQIGDPAVWGEIVNRTDLLGALSTLMEKLAKSAASIHESSVLAHVSNEDSASLFSGHRTVLDGYANVANAIHGAAMELAASKNALGQFTSIMGSFAKLLNEARWFVGPPGEGEAARAAEPNMERTKQRFEEVDSTQRLLDQMEAKHPTENRTARDATVLPLFDTKTMRGFDAAEREKWMAGLASLDPATLKTEVASLKLLFDVPSFATLSPKNRELLANLYTRLELRDRGGPLVAFGNQKLTGVEVEDANVISRLFARNVVPGALTGLVTKDDVARLRAAEELIEAHRGAKTKPFAYKVPNQERHDAIVFRLETSAREIDALRKSLDHVKAEPEKTRDKELKALPDYEQFLAFTAKIEELADKKGASEKKRKYAKAIMADWKSGRHDWKLNYGSEVGFGYYHDKDVAERQAPRVVGRETDKIAEINVELRQLGEEIARWDAYKREKVDPVHEKCTNAIAADRERIHAEIRTLEDERKSIRTEANDLVKRAFIDAGHRWAVDGNHLSWFGKNDTFDTRFKTGTYAEMKERIFNFVPVMQQQLGQSAQVLGIFEGETKTKRKEAHDFLTGNLTKFDGQVKDDALGKKRDYEYEQRIVWNALAGVLNRLAAVNPGSRW